MRKPIIAEFITLDGVIQAPGGENKDTESTRQEHDHTYTNPIRITDGIGF